MQHDGRSRRDVHGRDAGDPLMYSSFSQAADENAVSRIYIGIHFRKAVETGVHHGRRIAAYAVHQRRSRWVNVWSLYCR